MICWVYLENETENTAANIVSIKVFVDEAIERIYGYQSYQLV